MVFWLFGKTIVLNKSEFETGERAAQPRPETEIWSAAYHSSQHLVYIFIEILKRKVTQSE